MSGHLPALSTRRQAAWQRSGTSADYISWLAIQWDAYDRAHGISVHDRTFSMSAYNNHQARFTAWLEQRVEVGA